MNIAENMLHKQTDEALGCGNSEVIARLLLSLSISQIYDISILSGPVEQIKVMMSPLQPKREFRTEQVLRSLLQSEV